MNPQTDDRLAAWLLAKFNAYDTDGDGLVHEADFLAYARRVVERLGEPPDSALGQAFVDAYLRWWHRLRSLADHDGDGAVSRAEYVAEVTRLIGDRGEGYVRLIVPVLETVFRVVDRDGSETIDLAEYRRVIELLDATGRDAEEDFRALDTDGNAHVTLEELRSALRSFYRDATAGEPVGSPLFGPL